MMCTIKKANKQIHQFCSPKVSDMNFAGFPPPSIQAVRYIKFAIITSFYHRVPIFIDQSQEVMKLITKWQSILSDQGKEIAHCLTPEVSCMYFF